MFKKSKAAPPKSEEPKRTPLSWNNQYSLHEVISERLRKAMNLIVDVETLNVILAESPTFRALERKHLEGKLDEKADEIKALTAKLAVIKP